MPAVESVAIIVPVLNRPYNVEPLVQSVEAATTVPWTLMFVISPGDKAEHQAILDAKQSRNADHIRCIRMGRGPGSGDYANKINAGYEATSEPYLLLGADDLRFQPGWDSAVAEALARRPEVAVVGTNDGGNPRVLAGEHSTHSVVARRYIDDPGATMDQGPGVVLYNGYHHLFVDDELVLTAKHRGVWEFAADAHIDHLHPHWGKAKNDETYRRGNARFRADQAAFRKRAALWGGDTGR